MIDTHAHIQKRLYKDKLEEAIKKSVNSKLKYIINIAIDLETSKENLLLNNEHSKFIPTIGIHPSNTLDIGKDEINKMEKLLVENINKYVSIAEIGLDYYHDHDKQIQKWFFEKQLQLAIKYNKPVVLHIRDAYEDAYEILQKYQDIKYLAHSWNVSTKITRIYQQLPNIYFGYNGVITFKNAIEASANIKLIDINRILIETDSPFLTPEPNRGKTNYPEYVEYIAKKIADILEVNVDEIEKITTKNAMEFFGL